MGMLLHRHYVKNMAEGATEQVAPKPTLNSNNKNVVEEKAEVETKPEPKEEQPEEKKITRSDIMKMNVATVRAYAEKQGVEGAYAKSGAELKRILGDMLFEEDIDVDVEAETVSE